MSATLDYLEAASIDQLAARLERQGYTVQREYPVGPTTIDLVASRGGERIGYEVKAGPHLREAREQLRHLREATEHDGFTDFRLVVVSPPRETSVSVEGLDQLLHDRLINHTPGELYDVATNPRIEWVGSLEIGTVAITREGIELGGTGVVEVTLEFGDSRDPATSPDDFPFRFRVLLDHDLHLRRVEELRVDISGFDAEDTPTA